MECLEPDALLDYLAGRLDARVNARARAHLAGCAACHAVACEVVKEAAEGVEAPPRVRATSYELVRGASIAGRYVLERPIGEGAMGVVWVARSPEGERVAIKLLKGFDQAARRRFAREIAIASSLRHRSVVRVIEVLSDVEAGCPALVMELVEGESLADRLRGPRLPPGESRALGAELASALCFVHAAGVVHRDLKPANVLLRGGSTSAPTLLDLGLATVTEGSELSALSRITRTGQTVGTLAYMAPEQLAGAALTGAADVWSLGVTLFECVVGRAPFSARTPAELLRAIVRGPSPLSALDGEDPSLREVVARMLRHRAEERPSMREVLDALTSARAMPGLTPA